MTGTDNAVAIVTGAVGGMGAATAKIFAEQGRPLILCDLQAEPLQDFAASLKGSDQVETLAGDVADKGFSENLISTLKDRQIGALVHCAALSPSMAEGERIIDVNFRAVVRLVDAVRPKMCEGGCVVLISSIGAHMQASPEADEAVEALLAGQDISHLPGYANGQLTPYSLAKRAINCLAERQAEPFGERKARIVSLSPGNTDTSMGRLEQSAGPQIDKMLERTPLRRMGEAQEIASVAAFLCSPGASYVTGCDLIVDGGFVGAMKSRS